MSEAAEAYAAALRLRLGELSCVSCGASLQNATLLLASDGTTHDEHSLSEKSVATLLAATQRLRVECPSCGSAQETGVSLVQAPEAPSLSGEDRTPWSASAVAAYRSAIAERLSEGTCPTCDASLATGKVSRVNGGTALAGHSFRDVIAVKVIAWTQQLAVQCPVCGATVDV